MSHFFLPCPTHLGVESSSDDVNGDDGPGAAAASTAVDHYGHLGLLACVL